MTLHRSSRGFTMIELLVAATIIVVLSAVALVSFSSANRNARDAKRRGDLEQVRSALELYRSQNGTYPSSGSWGAAVTALYSAGYLSTDTITDPKGGSYSFDYNVSGGNRSYEVCATLEASTEPSGYNCSGSAGQLTCCLENP